MMGKVFRLHAVRLILVALMLAPVLESRVTAWIA